MRASIARAAARAAPRLLLLALGGLTGGAAFTPTPDTGTTPIVSATTSITHAPTFAPSPGSTAMRAPSRPSTSPTAAGEPSPGATSDARETPSAYAVPTERAAGVVREFRTPERAAPPAFVAPAGAPAASSDAAQDEAAAESSVPPDRPYVATITFRVAAATEVDGFELVIIYPRASGDFVGSGSGVECRTTGDATLFADDLEGGTLRLLVAGDHALTFPLDIVCRFTVEPHATLNARLIAVNVAEAAFERQRVEPSALSVAVSGR